MRRLTPIGASTKEDLTGLLEAEVLAACSCANLDHRIRLDRPVVAGTCSHPSPWCPSVGAGPPATMDNTGASRNEPMIYVDHATSGVRQARAKPAWRSSGGAAVTAAAAGCSRNVAAIRRRPLPRASAVSLGRQAGRYDIGDRPRNQCDCRERPSPGAIAVHGSVTLIGAQRDRSIEDQFCVNEQLLPKRSWCSIILEENN